MDTLKENLPWIDRMLTLLTNVIFISRLEELDVKEPARY